MMGSEATPADARNERRVILMQNPFFLDYLQCKKQVNYYTVFTVKLKR